MILPRGYHAAKSIVAPRLRSSGITLQRLMLKPPPHEDVDIVPRVEKMTPRPKSFQLRDPSAVREFLVHAHGHGANLVAEVADALVQLDVCQHASMEAFVGLTVPSNCLWKCNLSMLFATFERTTIRTEYFSSPRRTNYSNSGRAASASATADADELLARARAPGGALNVLKTRFSASAKNTICAGCLTLIRMHRFVAVRSRLWHWRRRNLSLAVSMTPRSIPKKSPVMFPNDLN